MIRKAMLFAIVVAFGIFILSECRSGIKDYGFTMIGRDGNTVLDFALARIVFYGVHHSGESDGDILINGWGNSKIMVNEATMPFSCASARGVTTIWYGGYVFSLENNGYNLRYGTNYFQLGRGKPTITLMRDGTARFIPSHD
jgi:hypothetical protein